MKKFFNRARNTLWILPRTLWTAGRWVVDYTKTALNTVLDAWIWMWKTFDAVKKAIHDSFNANKRYKRLWKMPASIVCLLPMLWEWTIETLRWTWVNTVVNTVATTWNMFINEWNAIKMLWKVDDPKTYVLSKTDFRNIEPKNAIAKLFTETPPAP